MRSPQAVRCANVSLLDLADRLVAEFEEIAAGSVLRCYARAVAITRRSGAPLESLPHVAEDLTRRMLARRHTGRALVGVR